MVAFEKLHAQVDPDPLKELRRRQQMWASAPDSRGEPLNACIVPDATVIGAIEEIERLRREVERLKRDLVEAQMQAQSWKQAATAKP